MKYFLAITILLASTCYAQEVCKVDTNTIKITTQTEIKLTYEQLAFKVKMAEIKLASAQKELNDAQALFNQAKAQGILARTVAIKPQVNLEIGK